MHLLLTDRLACPRCGPEFGLILLADRIEERRVLEGVLGCPNCRERYPVRGGFGDFRPPPRGALPYRGSPATDPPTAEETMRLAALLGVAEGPGNLLLAGAPVAHALPLARLVEEIEVVAVAPAAHGEEEQPGVSRIGVGRRLPFYSGMFRGVALEGAAIEAWLDEGIRLVARLGRLVLLEAADEERVRRVEEGGLELLVREGGILVAARK
jgi:uncharacterized protein YbaR (Trm112 family)